VAGGIAGQYLEASVLLHGSQPPVLLLLSCWFGRPAETMTDGQPDKLMVEQGFYSHKHPRLGTAALGVPAGTTT